MRKTFLFSAVLVLLSITPSSGQSENWKKLHQQALVVDLHTDVLLRVSRGEDISKRTSHGHVDLIRLKEGGVDVQFFAVWPNPFLYKPGKMYHESMRMIDNLHALVKKNARLLAFVAHPEEIQQAVNQGKIAACIGLEGGTTIENSLQKLEKFYRRGVRYLTITWNDSPEWATSAKDETDPYFKRQKGLTVFGKKLVRKMNELGMMVDISHSGEQTFWDVLEVSNKPVIASHSSVWNFSHHFRNLKDEQIKALAAKGGVIFINFYPGYLDGEFRIAYKKFKESAKAKMDSLASLYGDHSAAYYRERKRYIYQQMDAALPDVKKVVDHIDYIVQLVGEDFVGLGSDYDGIPIAPKGLEDVSKMPAITKELLERGYSEASIRKILGGNFMRVFREVSRK